MRKIKFSNFEYYHVYNRGVDKRKVFLDTQDVNKFMSYLNKYKVLKLSAINHLKIEYKIINLAAYNLLKNHFHLLLQQENNLGISTIMHRILTSYTMYFNQKYKRSGALFESTFKARHVDSDKYLRWISGYINLNHLKHGTESLATSYDEYTNKKQNYGMVCEKSKDLILGTFDNIGEYEKYTKDLFLKKEF